MTEPTTHSERVRVENMDQLCSHGLTGLRRTALGIAMAGLAACDGARATAETVELTPDGIEVAGVEYPLPPGSRLYVIGAGKATLPIARTLEQILGDRIDGGAIVLRRGVEAELDRIEVLIGDHPIPTPDSVTGATRLAEIADQVGPEDLVLACFTGGSSALASLPPAGVSFEEKRLLHELLLGSGIPITEVNIVRKHVSDIKGGRLAARIAPGRIVNLTVSDVAGDALDAVTDLTVADSSTVADALSVLGDYGLVEQIPDSIIRHLESAAADSPDLTGQLIGSKILVTGRSVCDAMMVEAADRGYSPVTLTTTLEGEAREMGRFVADLAVSSYRNSYPFSPGTVLLGCGGENVVAITGRGTFGQGGPGQEAAVAAAATIENSPIAALFMDTDGSDGGTDAAGAIVDGQTAGRARQLELDLRRALLNHSTREPLATLGDLVRTGPTGTNANDLFVIVIDHQLL